ncbi:SP_0009 family protein [Salmonella sp. ZJHZ20_0012]
MTEDILKTVKKFLSYSDEKLEELSQKNQELKFQNKKEER